MMTTPHQGAKYFAWSLFSMSSMTLAALLWFTTRASPRREEAFREGGLEIIHPHRFQSGGDDDFHPSTPFWSLASERWGFSVTFAWQKNTSDSQQKGIDIIPYHCIYYNRKGRNPYILLHKLRPVFQVNAAHYWSANGFFLGSIYGFWVSFIEVFFVSSSSKPVSYEK